MNKPRLLVLSLLAASAWPVLSLAQAPAAPAAAPAPQAFVAPLNAPQFAAMSAMNAAVAPLNQALTAARDDLTKAAFTLPPNPADLVAKAEAIAKAELAVANARADAIARVQAGPSRLSAGQLQALSAPGGRGGRGGNTMGMPPTVAPGAVVEKLATLPRESYTVGVPFTEGATSAPNGDVYFVEQNSSKIMKWSVADKTLSVFMHPAGYANGMSFDYKGNLIVAADERNELWSVSLTETETIPYPTPLNPAVGDPDRPATITRPKVTVLMDGKYNGKLLGGPNDVWCAPNGDIYFTDPHYGRSWWNPPNRPSEQDIRTVYYLSADRKIFRRALSDFNNVAGVAGMPNGIIGTKDGKTLYVANINGGEIWGFDIQPDGTLTNKRVVCHSGADGMTLDEQGNLYLSSGGVAVYSTKTGQQIGFIQVPEAPANVAFGGPDHKTLYMTARTGFYSIQMNVRGENPGK
jgi:gluconolactonase